MPDVSTISTDFGSVIVNDDGILVVCRAYNHRGGLLSEKVLFKRTIAMDSDEISEAKVNNYDKLGSTISIIERMICNEFSVKRSDLSCTSRISRLAEARHVAFWMLREFTPLSVTAIGKIYKRDHSTILHGVAKIKDLMYMKPEYSTKLEGLKADIANIINRPADDPAQQVV